MQLAIVAAGFTAGEADQLRRSMAAWKRRGGVDHFRDKLINGMLARNYTREFAEAIFRQIQGFGEYGFPESHAASFALLVYVSCWLKCYEPACFLAALLDSQAPVITEDTIWAVIDSVKSQCNSIVAADKAGRALRARRSVSVSCASIRLRMASTPTNSSPSKTRTAR